MAQAKYNEDHYFTVVQDYIKSTYGEHYALDDNIQALDVWKALGIAESACQATALKYIMRYGRKAGKNRKDLLKAMHYILLLMHFEDEAKKKDPVKTESLDDAYARAITPTIAGGPSGILRYQGQ